MVKNLDRTEAFVSDTIKIGSFPPFESCKFSQKLEHLGNLGSFAFIQRSLLGSVTVVLSWRRLMRKYIAKEEPAVPWVLETHDKAYRPYEKG